MVRRWLVEDTPQGAVGREVEILEKPDRVAPLSSPLAWRILQELARAPDYPNALAARLNVHEQKVYYHVRRLERAGLLEVIREESKRGASARVLEEFSSDGMFNGSIVVGSPYTHGPFSTTSRDSPYAVELGFFLGRLFAAPKRPLVRLDTELKAAGPGRDHLILVGGPVANIITMDLNPHLAVNFDWKQVWRMASSRTKRHYADEQVGLIAKVRSPWNPSRAVVLLGGLHAVGTMAAILGVTQSADDVLDGYKPGEDFYRVVAGQDRDADGRIDTVSILE